MNEILDEMTKALNLTPRAIHRFTARNDRRVEFDKIMIFKESFISTSNRFEALRSFKHLLYTGIYEEPETTIQFQN